MTKNETPAPADVRTMTYLRVSTDRQAKSGLGIEAQREQAANYIRYKELPNPFEPFIDPGVSGKKPFIKRPQGRRLHDALRRGDHLIVTKVDRAFRDLGDQIRMTQLWRDMGIVVHFLDLGLDTTTPMGEFALNVIGALAQAERRRIAERCRDARDAAIARGQPYGNSATLGYHWLPARKPRPDHKWDLIEDLWTRKIMEYCVHWWKGGRSAYEIAAELTRRDWKILRRKVKDGKHVFVQDALPSIGEPTQRGQFVTVQSYLAKQLEYMEHHPERYASDDLPHKESKPGDFRYLDGAAVQIMYRAMKAASNKLAWSRYREGMATRQDDRIRKRAEWLAKREEIMALKGTMPVAEIAARYGVSRHKINGVLRSGTN